MISPFHRGEPGDPQTVSDLPTLRWSWNWNSGGLAAALVSVATGYADPRPPPHTPRPQSLGRTTASRF